MVNMIKDKHKSRYAKEILQLRSRNRIQNSHSKLQMNFRIWNFLLFLSSLIAKENDLTTLVILLEQQAGLFNLKPKK